MSLQVVLPLGDTPDRRAGRDPVRDSKAYPSGGPCTHGVTGEAVCIRRAPDEAAVRRQAHRLILRITQINCRHLILMLVTNQVCQQSPKRLRTCRDLQRVLDSGIRSIAVVLKHAAIFPDHEEAIGRVARDLGFQQVPYFALSVHQHPLLQASDTQPLFLYSSKRIGAGPEGTSFHLHSLLYFLIAQFMLCS